MKITLASAIVFLLSTTITSHAIPTSDKAIRHGNLITITPVSEAVGLEGRDLEKRRGGGGGGRGGGGGGSSGGGSGGRGGGGGSSSSSSSHPGARPGSTSTTSNSGGTSRGGSGARPTYGRGGGYYAGGATVPYRSGIRSPLGITPFFLPVAALAFFPGLWLYGAHVYPYGHPYHYINDTTKRNESMPVICLCAEYSTCGCDDNNNNTYYESLFNGTQPKNDSIVRVANVNSTQTIAINGTLPNGTTADEATVDSAAALAVVQTSRYWLMAAVTLSAACTL